MCRWENEKFPPNFDPNFDPYLPKIKNLPRFREMFAKFISNLPKCWRFFRKFRENRLLKKIYDPLIYQNFGLRRGHSFTRGERMGPYSAAHHQYLLSPEYRSPRVKNTESCAVPRVENVLTVWCRSLSNSTINQHVKKMILLFSYLESKSLLFTTWVSQYLQTNLIIRFDFFFGFFIPMLPIMYSIKGEDMLVIVCQILGESQIYQV